MKLKRIAAGFVAAVMALAVLGTPLGDILPFVRESVATTAGAETYGDYSYKVLDNGTVEITGYSGSEEKVDIPAEIDGKSVTSIGWNAFYDCKSLVSITIPNSVTSIGTHAFHGCTSLTSITIPDSVTSIGYFAFVSCASLTSIAIPDSVTSIGGYAFECCTSLTSITIPDSVTSIGYGAFYYCESLTSITIPDSVTWIGEKVFYGCKSLTSTDVAEANKFYSSVDGVLFNKDKTELICYPPRKVDDNYSIPNSVTSIGDGAFAGCTSLTSITIPDSVTSIGDGAFAGCTSLTSITIPDSVTSIGDSAFYGCTSLTSITIPDGVTEIAYNTFIGCTSLATITIPNSVTVINNGAFIGCTSLTSITISDSVTSIGHSAFEGCTSIKSITIPNGVTSIGSSAFDGCSSLTSVTIPESVVEIGPCSFYNCIKLCDVYIFNYRNINISYDAFANIWLDNLSLSIHGYAGTAVEEYAKKCGINFISLGRYYEIPPVPSRTSYYLKVTDEDGNVINDAKVTDGNKQFTGSNGIFKLDGVSGSKVTVSSDKFRDTDVSLSRLSSSGVNNVSSSDDVSLSAIYYSKDSSVDSAFESGTIGELISKGQAAEVLSNATTIELKQTKWSRTEYYDFYLYCAGDTDDISSYSVVCGSKTLCSSSTPKLKLNTSMLAEGEALTLECKNSDGKSKTYKINLKIADNTRSSLSRELSINSASVNLPDELSWLGSVNLSLPTIPVYAKVSGDEVRVGVGVNKDVLETYDGFDGFKKAYNKFKTDYSKSNKYFAADSLAELKKTYLENSNKSELPGIGSVDISVVGCGYAKFDGNGITSVDFDLIITAEAKAEFSSQFFVTVVPVTVKIEAGVKVEGDFQATLTGIATDNFNFTGNIELEITPFVKPYAGIGIDNVANVGVFGQVELPVKICLLNTDASKVGLKSIDLRGKAGLQANVLFFSYDLTLFEGSINLYTRPESLMSSTIAQREAVMSCVKYENAVQAAQNIANYSAVSNTTEYTVTDSNEGLIANNVSLLSSSDVLVTDDMTILASVNSDLSRGINNQTYIATTVFKDGKWSEIKAVNDSSLAEFAPKLYKSGNDIFLIYQQALKTFDDSAESSEITKNIGIAVSKFNPETLTFENTNTVYSTAGYSTEPKTYDGYSVWLTNSEGDPFGKSDNNSIIVYDGSSATTLADNISNAVSVDIGKLSGDTYIAYLTDGDGDLSTADDIRLYAVTKNGGTPVQVDEGAIESFEFAKVGDGKLVWNKEGKLYTIDSENASACDTGICINGDFGILDDGTLYYTGSTSEQSAVYLMKAGENTWENPYEYFTCNGNINKTYSDGQSILVDAADFADPDCAHRLYLTKSVECKDIIVEAVSFDPGYIVSGSQIPLTLALTNNGSETVQTAAFRITDEEMNTISVYTLDNLDIKPGSTTECTILVKPEDNCLNKKVYVTVIEPTDSSELSDSALDADLEKDRTVENNKYLLDFTKSDLEVKIEEYLLGKNNSLIFTVMNNTDVATGGTLSITDSDGNELLSKHYDDITFNNSQIVELKVSQLISKGKAGDVITATVTGDNDDYNEYNNTAGHSIKLKLDEAIDSFTASDIGKTQLTLNWSGLTKKCGVFIEQLVGDEWKEIATLNDGSVGKYTVSGLTETTSYSFRIRAFENFGSETGYGEYQLLETSTCHNFGEWVTVTESTCTEDGEESRTCEVCGKTETRRTAATGHDYSDQWTIDEEADCVNDGSKSRHCSRCNAKTDVTVIEAKGHTEVVDKAVAATCTADGYTEGKHCSVCNAVIKAQEKIAATGHKYIETVVEPSYSNRGYTLYECSVCGYSYKDNYEEQLIVPAVTGFASGSQTKSSAVLGWDKVSGADGYAVELYTGGKWNEVFRTSDSSVTSCTVGSLKADSTYSLRIRAFKDTDDGTVYSDYTRLAVKTKLAGVTGLKAQGVTATAVKLDWARNAGATGYIIEQYKGGKWTQLAVTKNNTTLTFTVKGLAECTPYSFRVKTYKNDGGKTNYSDYVTVKASTLLGTVKNAKVTSTTGTWITLGWDRNTGATGYVLEQYKGGRWTEIAVTKNNTTLKFTVKGLKNDTTYSFRIRTYKTVGDTTTYGSYVRIVGTTDIPNVAKFTGSAVSASAVKLDWSKNDKATGYVIEQYKGGRWTEIKAVDNDITEITVEGLAKGTAYTFRIKSVKTVDGADKSSEYASVKVNTAE